MKAIDQTGFGAAEGNCFAACVASIIECDDLDELSRQIGVGLTEYNEATGEHWFDCACRVLAERGFALAWHPEGSPVPTGYYIMGGMSPRELPHVVVAHDDEEIAHDPHPSRGGIVGPFDYFTISQRT